MHAIAFGTKRTFHGFLRITRRAFASLGLTAARFDLMFAVLRNPTPTTDEYPVRQSDLRRTLGVTPGVVSRMLRSLEILGLVIRRRHEGDRRQRLVNLTALGKKCVIKARRLLLGRIHWIVCKCICFGSHADPNERLFNMDHLEGYLRVLRRDFGDAASLYYPWGHPDD